MATQTHTFLFADVEGSTAMWRRLGLGYAREFVSPPTCGDVAVQVQRALVWHA